MTSHYTLLVCLLPVRHSVSRARVFHCRRARKIGFPHATVRHAHSNLVHHSIHETEIETLGTQLSDSSEAKFAPIFICDHGLPHAHTRTSRDRCKKKREPKAQAAVMHASLYVVTARDVTFYFVSPVRSAGQREDVRKQCGLGGTRASPSFPSSSLSLLALPLIRSATA